MIVYTMLGITLLIALYCIVAIWRSASRRLKYNWARLLGTISTSSFIYLYGTWVYLSVYAKYVFGALILAGLIAGLVGRKREQPVVRKNAVLHLLVFFVFGGLSILYFTGTTGKAKEVALSFPLKTGKYFVLQGGKGLPTNIFHYGFRGAVYAMDIVKLNDFGNRAEHVFSSKLEDYRIFGDTIYSPCDGLIGRAVDDNPDNIPPSRERGPHNTNSVLIETDSFYVFMAHLKERSVFVKEGDVIRTGQPLGLAGNSGFSLEPHLHIQVHEKTNKGPWYKDPPLYISFDGRSYLMFEVISPRRVDMVNE